MTSEASNDPEVFLTQVDEALEDVTDAINDFLEKSLTVMNAVLNAPQAGVAGFVGGVKGLFSGGIDGAIEGYSEAYVNEILSDWNQGSGEVRAAWEEAQGVIRESISAILGDPLKMSTISSAYRDAVELLGQGVNDVNDATAYVEESWQGLAKTAYSRTAVNQLKALQGVADTLSDSADLLDDHAVELVQYWSSQLSNLISLAASVIDAAGELGDAGNWISGGAGVVVSVIASAATGSATIVDEAVSYWAELNIGKAGNWDSIQSKLAGRGLEGDLWPDYSSQNSTNINGPWEPA